MGAVRRRNNSSEHRAVGASTGRGAGSAGLELRPANPGDTPAIIELLRVSLGWHSDDRHRALFAWKHLENPFGPSPSWVAVDDEGLVGVRIFMRWGFVLDDRSVRAVRAVDTATHPRARGRGVFRALTMRGVDEMTTQGVDWVFNTPNKQSLPGYLSMGWDRLGRLSVAIRPTGPGSIPRLASARVPAELWSVPTSAGEDVASVLSDEKQVADLLASQPIHRGGVRTGRTAAFLRWRYAASPVGYRAMLAGASLSDGVMFFRLRHRGPSTEVVIADAMIPAANARMAARLGRRVLEESGGDYAVAVGATRPRGWLRVPRIGPVLTWRPLADTDRPPINRWELSTGDVELF